MSSVVEIATHARQVLRALFEKSAHDTVLIRSVLEGHFGSALADSESNPSVARLDSGAFTMLAGDPHSSAVPALLRERPISY